MRAILVLSLFALGCAGLGTEPPAVSDSAGTVEATTDTSTQPAYFIAPGDHTPEEIYEKLQAIAMESARGKPRPRAGKEFSLALPSDKPEGDQSKEWISDSVQVSYKDQKNVDQITLITQTCNVKLENLDPANLNKRVQSQVALVSKTLFGAPFHLSDKYFAEPGPDWTQQLRIPIRQEYLPVVDMRLIRGPFQCDGRSGFGYRYDFFMK